MAGGFVNGLVYPDRCPLCKGRSLSDLGLIYHPAPTLVAGVEIDLQGIEFQLRRCNDCAFQFKSPHIPEARLMACYEAAKNDHWGLDVDPVERNFDRCAEAVRAHATGTRILDIGCFSGAFLHYLGDAWDRYGVEPSRGAREVASQRGIQILGSTWESIPAHSTFDVITAFDVIEHLVDPMPLFNKLRHHLAPGGVIVVSSGDTDSMGWRMQKARYWYCSYLPEHVSFFCRKTLDFIADRNQLDSVMHVHLSNKKASPKTRLVQFVNGWIYVLLLNTRWLRVRKLEAKFGERAGTIWDAANDHFIHVMKRIE